MQLAARAFSRAWAKTGKRIAARMAIIAITTSSSMRVKAGRADERGMQEPPLDEMKDQNGWQPGSPLLASSGYPSRSGTLVPPRAGRTAARGRATNLCGRL